MSNTGDANGEPNNNVTVRLAFDTTAFQLVNPQDTVKTVQLVNKVAPISWQMRTMPDANINTNPYFLTATIDSTLSWDENDFPSRGVHLEKVTASDTLNIVGLGTFAIASAYLNTPGSDSLTVSTFQAVQVVVVPQKTGLFVNRVATLYLPEIFPADSLVASIPAGGNPVSFNNMIRRHAVEISLIVNPDAYPSYVIHCPNADVPLDFAAEMLSLTVYPHLCPVRHWSDGTHERAWATALTDLIIIHGWAVPAVGNKPAALVVPLSTVSERLGIT